jgi:hypothetical protein
VGIFLAQGFHGATVARTPYSRFFSFLESDFLIGVTDTSKAFFFLTIGEIKVKAIDLLIPCLKIGIN